MIPKDLKITASKKEIRLMKTKVNTKIQTIKISMEVKVMYLKIK